MWQVTCDKWQLRCEIFFFFISCHIFSDSLRLQEYTQVLYKKHVTSDKWHVTSDMWHVTCDNIFLSSYLVIYFWISWDPGVYSSALQVTSDKWQVTSDKWHVTCNNIFVTYHVIYFRIPWDSRSILKCLKSDMWQVTSEKWHMTSHKWHVNFVLLFISCHIFSGKIYLTIIYFNPPLLPFTLGPKTLGPKTLNIWVSILNNLMGYMRLKF